MVVTQMKNFVESLSLGSGAILIAVLSAAVVWFLSSVLPSAPRWLWVIVVPLIFAYSLYWSPVWLGADASEYSAWAILCVGTWFVAGTIALSAIVLILRKRHSKTT